MEFKAHVTIVDAPDEQQHKKDTEHAKSLIMQAIQILSKSEPSVVHEAEAFLKEVGVAKEVGVV